MKMCFKCPAGFVSLWNNRMFHCGTESSLVHWFIDSLVQLLMDFELEFPVKSMVSLTETPWREVFGENLPPALWQRSPEHIKGAYNFVRLAFQK